MVVSCCAAFCTNRHKKDGLPFHRFPSDPERFQLWVRAIKRRNNNADKEWIPTEYDRVCGAHFQTGRASTDKLNPDYVPNVFKTQADGPSDPSNDDKKRRSTSVQMFETGKRRCEIKNRGLQIKIPSSCDVPGYSQPCCDVLKPAMFKSTADAEMLTAWLKAQAEEPCGKVLVEKSKFSKLHFPKSQSKAAETVVDLSRDQPKLMHNAVPSEFMDASSCAKRKKCHNTDELGQERVVGEAVNKTRSIAEEVITVNEENISHNGSCVQVETSIGNSRCAKQSLQTTDVVMNENTVREKINEAEMLPNSASPDPVKEHRGILTSNEVPAQIGEELHLKAMAKHAASEEIKTRLPDIVVLRSSGSEQCFATDDDEGSYDFAVGLKFSSYEELQNYILKFEVKHSVKLERRNSMTALSTTYKKKNLNPDLQFGELTLCCSRCWEVCTTSLGGVGQGAATHLGSFHVRLIASQSGTHLVVDYVLRQHNHETQNGTEGSLLQQMKAILSSVHGGHVQFSVNSTDELQSVCFNDDKMKDMFHAFPEVLVVDTVQSVNDPLTRLYLFFIVDGNGENEMVAACLTVAESTDAMAHLCRFLKRWGKRWERVKVVTTNKDFTARPLLRTEFPKAAIQIHFDDVTDTFLKEAEQQRLPKVKPVLCTLLRHMSLATSADEYVEWYRLFRSVCHPSLLEHYDENWHPVARQWVNCFKKQHMSLNASTSENLVRIKNELQQMVFVNCSPKEMAYRFLLALPRIRAQADERVIKSLAKLKSSSESITCSDMLSYQQYLTPYAFRCLQPELEKADTADIYQMSTTAFCFNSGDASWVVTTATCSCAFYKCMALPCRHIFAVRRNCGLSLFSEKLVHQRWSLLYYLTYRRSFTEKKGDMWNGALTNGSKEKCSVASEANTRKPATPKVALEKRHEVGDITSPTSDAELNRKLGNLFPHPKKDSLAPSRLDRNVNLCSRLAMFATEQLNDERYDVLQALSEHWERGERVTVSPLVFPEHISSQSLPPQDSTDSERSCHNVKNQDQNPLELVELVWDS